MWQGRGRQETPKDSESRLRSARVRPRPAFSCSLALGSGVQLGAPVPRGSSVGPERNKSGLQGWWLNRLQHKSVSDGLCITVLHKVGHRGHTEGPSF